MKTSLFFFFGGGGTFACRGRLSFMGCQDHHVEKHDIINDMSPTDDGSELLHHLGGIKQL